MGPEVPGAKEAIFLFFSSLQNCSGEQLCSHASVWGMQVTLSYVDLAASTPTRQKALKEQYFFDCCCSRCLRRVSNFSHSALMILCSRDE